VPFVIREDAGLLRGTIDCLVRQPQRVIVLEFKTGRHQPGHRVQAGIYERAARALFPDSLVESRLVYADGTIL
jgi:ATP-dependent exoDNAse (exonuclease V) beta subunit